ncbi:LysR family transcriptional regulator [Isoptericola jiangsuensis]|uniref:LysR family transcriptional regulator n=1 Tax=Isoptericola jiangsuensis TaxID=548579 RepID=UPI0038634A1A
MERRHLQYFVALSEALHFGRAAEKLGIATPTLTVQIKDIERRIGAELFKRDSRTVSLTPVGETLLHEARSILQKFALAEDLARRVGRGESGRIEVGFVGSAVHTGVLQHHVWTFREQVPGVELLLTERPMHSIPGLLQEGALDIGVVRPPLDFPDTLESVPLHVDEFCVAISSRHSLAHTKSRVKPKELSREVFILPEQSAGTWEVARRGRFTPSCQPCPGSLIAVLGLVSIGNCIAIVPSVLMESALVPGVVYRGIAGPPIRSGLLALYRSGDPSQAVQRLVAQMRGEHQRDESDRS